MTDWPELTPEQTSALQSICYLVLLRGIELGLEAAAKAADDGADRLAGEWKAGHKGNSHLEGKSDGMDEAAVLIRALSPETIAKEAQRD